MVHGDAVHGDVVQSIQITFHHSSFPIAIADVLKRNLIILNYVPPPVVFHISRPDTGLHHYVIFHFDVMKVWEILSEK